jgi:ankyrin repeat protein
LALGAPIEHKGGNLKWSPLIIAAQHGHIEVVTLLVERGANLDARDDNGWTALIRASFKGHLAVVKFLSDKGASINTRGNNAYDALLWAAVFGYLDVCLFLVSRSGDPRVMNRSNMSALTYFGIYAYSRLSPEERQAGKDQIHAAWLAGPHPDARWLRRRGLILALVGSKLRPMARDIAAAKQEQEQNDKHVSLPGIPRRTKQENWNYLLKEVFGHEGIVRCVADKM